MNRARALTTENVELKVKPPPLWLTSDILRSKVTVISLSVCLCCAIIKIHNYTLSTKNFYRGDGNGKFVIQRFDVMFFELIIFRYIVIIKCSQRCNNIKSSPRKNALRNSRCYGKILTVQSCKITKIWYKQNLKPLSVRPYHGMINFQRYYAFEKYGQDVTKLSCFENDNFLSMHSNHLNFSVNHEIEHLFICTRSWTIV